MKRELIDWYFNNIDNGNESGWGIAYGNAEKVCELVEKARAEAVKEFAEYISHQECREEAEKAWKYYGELAAKFSEEQE